MEEANLKLKMENLSLKEEIKRLLDISNETIRVINESTAEMDRILSEGSEENKEKEEAISKMAELYNEQCPRGEKAAETILTHVWMTDNRSVIDFWKIIYDSNFDNQERSNFDDLSNHAIKILTFEIAKRRYEKGNFSNSLCQNPRYMEKEIWGNL